MVNYNLKNKIQVTKTFLEELKAKGWQEIENLQNQIANIEVTKDNNTILKLFNNLLTSYYIFVGEIENLLDEQNFENDLQTTSPEIENTELRQNLATAEPDIEELPEETISLKNKESSENISSEPFEYLLCRF